MNAYFKPEINSHKSITSWFSSLLLIYFFSIPQAYASDIDGYLSQSLEELMASSIISVSKKKENIKDTSASVYVLTNKQIKRSGYQTLPDLLKMVPGIQVSMIDANTWVISARGFNDLYAYKLLVLQDGRTLYNPVFSGVYWDAQVLPVDEIDRIEVIRGPGSVIWGANAVNGVINIITNKPDHTLGSKITATVAKNAHDELYLKHGFKVNDSVFARVYLNAKEHDSNVLNGSDENAFDNGESLQAGFHLGKHSGLDDWGIHADLYELKQNQMSTGLTSPFSPAQSTLYEQITGSGWSLLSHWQRGSQTEAGERFDKFQFFIDHHKREELVLEQEYTTLDLEYVARHPLNQQNELTYGIGYRHIWDEYKNTFRVSLTPDKSDYFIANAFIQDELILTPELLLTFGAKLEKQEHYNAELSPSLRFNWKNTDKSSIWGAVSRAIHMPGRFERSGSITSALVPLGLALEPISISGMEGMEPEELISYEAGFRLDVNERLSIDTAVFYNKYDNLLSYETNGFKTVFDNNIQATSYGSEISTIWKPNEWWQLQLGYSYINIDAEPSPNSTDTISKAFLEGNTAQSQFKLSSWMDITNNLSLNITAQHLTERKQTQPNSQEKRIAANTHLNANFTWQIDRDLKLSLVGQNLLGHRTLEHLGPSYLSAVDIERSIYAKLDFSF